ncbi:MAG TPA: hypothetical protein VII72_02045 [Myxococcota bacterium]|jgi:hypothetical protein
MPPHPPAAGAAEFAERLEKLGRNLGEREASHQAGLSEARACLERVRGWVCEALEAFHQAATAAGAPQLRISLSEVRPDEKHLRAAQFDLNRGRYRAIVTARSRGEITLVGPFHAGKTEGPCLTFPLDGGEDLRAALARFLERFLEEAATP